MRELTPQKGNILGTYFSAHSDIDDPVTPTKRAREVRSGIFRHLPACYSRLRHPLRPEHDAGRYSGPRPRATAVYIPQVDTLHWSISVSAGTTLTVLAYSLQRRALD